MTIVLDHIAILTTSLKTCIEQIPKDYRLHEIEEHPAEGTKEIYISTPADNSPSILFMEACQPGPYLSALNKRGPGIHHLGCITDSLDDAVEHFTNAGLLLHPISLKTYEENVVWICRPGVPYLIELYTVQNPVNLSPVEVLIKLPNAACLDSDFNQYIRGVTISNSTNETINLSIDGYSISVMP